MIRVYDITTLLDQRLCSTQFHRNGFTYCHYEKIIKTVKTVQDPFPYDTQVTETKTEGMKTKNKCYEEEKKIGYSVVLDKDLFFYVILADVHATSAQFFNPNSFFSIFNVTGCVWCVYEHMQTSSPVGDDKQKEKEGA